MEKELNIAAILRDKPENTKLWCSIYGEAYLKKINSNEIVNITHHGGYNVALTENGKSWNDGECVLFPSKSMRDWSKFAWKKGDVLFSNNTLVVFNRFVNDDYTDFEAAFEGYQNETYDEGNIFFTDDFSKATDDGAKDFIKNIEGHYGGKLNLETLEIEKPKQEFKDGDIVVVDYVEGVVFICICYKVEDNFMYCHARMNSHNKDLYLEKAFLKVNLVNRNPRPATDSEKQQLFDAIAKENKAWDAGKKQIVNLPKKCEFKPMDWCLMRDFNETWKLCQFGFMEKGHVTGNALYDAVGGNTYEECIPYNDKTAHLLGTTDDWKGGEE